MISGKLFYNSLMISVKIVKHQHIVFLLYQKLILYNQWLVIRLTLWFINPEEVIIIS